MVLIAIIVILLIIILYITYKICKKKYDEDNLNGFWKADPIFCEEAGLHSFIVRIDDGDGYILAFNSDGVIINNAIRLDLSEGIINKLGLGDNSDEERRYDAAVDWLGETCECLPGEMTFYYYPQCGKLVFANPNAEANDAENKIYAVLYKDYSMSDIVRKLPFDE